MEKQCFGNELSTTILIQPVDDHDLGFIENEVKLISEFASPDFRLIALKVNNWNNDLSPWQAPPVFGKEGFGDGATDTLKEVLSLCADKNKTYYVGGYSLAGLFALWSAFQTDVFAGAAVFGGMRGVAVCVVSGVFGVYAVQGGQEWRCLLEPWRQGRENEESSHGEGR